MKLRIKNISKKFGSNLILNDINLTLETGKIYGLIGRNGTGKSLLLKIICGFYAPTSGEILWDGEDYIAKNSFPKDTRTLIEKPNFLPDLTGLENLKLLASIQDKIDEYQIIDTMKKVNLQHEIHKKYGKYSLGTKQKLGIAQVLMEDPQMIILDEPFNGVEKETVDNIRALLLEEKKKGKLIILATHIREDIETLADVVYELDGGKLTKVEK